MKFACLLFLISLPGWAKWSVTTFNIRNFEGTSNVSELEKIIKDVKADVMAFEEVVSKDAFDRLIKKTLPGYAYEISECGGFGKQHLAIAYNTKNFDFVNQLEDLTFSGSHDGCGSLRPLLLVSLKQKSSGKIFSFGVAHLKAGGGDRAMEQRWQQYTKLRLLAREYAHENLILLGDLNTTGYNIKNEDYERFENFISESKMRTMVETFGCTSYWEGTLGGKEYQASLLDHIIVQDKIVSSVESVKVGSHCQRTECRPATPEELGISFQSVSDHCPVQVNFK